MRQEEPSAYSDFLAFFGRSTEWMFGRTPPAATVTPERNLLSSSSLRTASVSPARSPSVLSSLSLPSPLPRTTIYQIGQSLTWSLNPPQTVVRIQFFLVYLTN